MAGIKFPSPTTSFSRFLSTQVRFPSSHCKPCLSIVTTSSRASSSCVSNGGVLDLRSTRGLRRHFHRVFLPSNKSACFSTSCAWSSAAPQNDQNDGKHQSTERLQKTKSSPSKPTKLTQALRENIASRLSSARHENIYTLPNILTFSRLLATPVIGYLIIHNQHLPAVILFAYAGITDLIDGWYARKFDQQTVVGSVVDPMADKALMTTLVGCLAVNGSMPLPLATIILGRDISLAIAAIYYRYASLPAPKTFARYWDFSLPSAEVHPTTVSKFNTFLQLILIGATLVAPLMISSEGEDDTPVAASHIIGVTGDGVPVEVEKPAAEKTPRTLKKATELLGGSERIQNTVTSLQVVVAATTIWSGLSYTVLKDAVTILGPNEVLKKKQGFRGRMIIAGSFGSVLALAGLLAVRDWRREEDDERRSK